MLVRIGQLCNAIGTTTRRQYCSSFVKLAEDSSASLYVCAGLYHGGSVIGRTQHTDLIDINNNPRWKQWLQFRIPMRDLPRVCSTACHQAPFQ
jgi:hypothetical protein